jgi:hypothetical protein
MKSMPFNTLFRICVLTLLTGVVAHAASVTGTVTNKTTGKPSAGDTVALVDVQAGMSDAVTVTTDSHGLYTMQSPGMGPYLVRVNHQGATYFIAAPQGSTPGDVTVYDVSAKLDEVSIDADMILAEGAGGMLRVQERYLVRNRSLPPKAQFSDNTFEIVLPQGAELDGASATRPGGLGTNTRLKPLSQKGHYTFNVPIQPDNGEKETMFEVQYHMSYSGKFTFSPQLRMPADNLVVYVPKSMNFSGASGANFQSVQEDPRVQTHLAKNVHPGQAISFVVSGEGQMPRDQPSSAMGKTAGAGMGEGGTDDARASGKAPGGGLGNPIDAPDPLSKYKWWILAGLAVVLAGAAVFLLRNRDSRKEEPSPEADLSTEGRPVLTPRLREEPPPTVVPSSRPLAAAVASRPAGATGNAMLLSSLKEELFAIETERLQGTISQDEYAEIKLGLEAILKRALHKS